jgi:hypothetical protein
MEGVILEGAATLCWAICNDIIFDNVKYICTQFSWGPTRCDSGHCCSMRRRLELFSPSSGLLLFPCCLGNALCNVIITRRSYTSSQKKHWPIKVDHALFLSQCVLNIRILTTGNRVFWAATIIFSGPPKIAGHFRRPVRTIENNRLFSAVRKNRQK